MHKKDFNLWFLVALLLVSYACSEQKIIVKGNVNNITGDKEESLEIKLHLNGEITPNRYYKRASVRSDGSFQMKAKSGHSYVLEISGKEGSGRLFLPAGNLSEKVEITYPVTERIVILHTNDRHFDLNMQDEFAQKVEEIRTRYDDVYLFEAGDVFVRHAHRWIVNDSLIKDTAWYRQHALSMIREMNKLGYDVMTLGNHELGYINDYTRHALAAAHFPVLAANMHITTDRLPQPEPFIILNTSTNRRIAVLGLATDNTRREGIKELDLAMTIDKYKSLKDFSDVFLVLSHLGLPRDLRLAEDFPFFDAIIGGHTHHLLKEPVIKNSVLVAHAGGNPHFISDEHPVYLGKVVLTLINGKVTDKKGEVLEIGRK